MLPAQSIAAYIHAKDGNRPHLLDAAFATDASLQMRVRTDAISFPPALQGRTAIAETLVRKFNQVYENIYTLCIGSPPAADASVFSCAWLVVMSEKEGGAVRIGCGRYDWSFGGEVREVRSLTIAIEAMEILPCETLAPVMDWVSGLPYPWCSHGTIDDKTPDIAGVRQVLQALPQLRV